MKRIFTLLTLLVSVLSGFSQVGTTYRWVSGSVTLNSGSVSAQRANFLSSTRWQVVNSNGTLGANASPTAGAKLQIYGVTITVSTNDIDLRSHSFDITIGGGTSSNTNFSLTGGTDLRLGFGSIVTLAGRNNGTCRTATISLSNTSDIRIYSADSSTRVLKAENNNPPVRTLTANCISGTSNYVAATGANPGGVDANNNFVGFIAQAGGASLPLQLGGFSAQKGTGKVTLNWSTVLEVNTSHFEVEQSNNGSTWKTISIVAAKGNSNSAQQYSAEDIAAYSSKVYYRLKMVDIDGKFEYSPIAVVTFGGKGKLFAYPNPATSFTMVSSDKAITENVTVSIFNTTGVLVKQQVITNPGNNFRIGLEDLKQGTYLLKINQGAELLEVIKIQKN